MALTDGLTIPDLAGEPGAQPLRTNTQAGHHASPAGSYEKLEAQSSNALRARRAIHWPGLLFSLFLTTCGGSGAGAKDPEPSLAGSRESQQSYRALEQRWLSAAKEERRRLEQPLQDFILRFPEDDRARDARIFLAWIWIEQGKFDRAREALAEVERGPPGTVFDQAVIAEAAVFTAEKKPERALLLLRPLRGKIADPDQRLIFGEQMLKAATLAGRWSEAFDAVFEWLASARAGDQEWVQNAVLLELKRMPTNALERGLTAYQQGEASAGESGKATARQWLLREVRTELAARALGNKDAKLARRLLEKAPVELRISGPGEALGRLAAEGETVKPRVWGRSVGLMLSLGNDDARRRSAAVATGMSHALGISAKVQSLQAVRLVMREDSGGPDDAARALAGLAGDGAAILVGGVDQASAERAAAYAEASAIPTILLYRPPGAPKATSQYTFLLGADQQVALKVLEREVAARGIQSVAEVGPEVCESELSVSTARFPVERWRQTRAQALMLLGDASCARSAASQATAAGLRLGLVFGLECAELLGSISGHEPQLALGAARFPEPARSGTLPGFRSSWYSMLGEDAVKLVTKALASFPLDRIDDAHAVAELHRRAKTDLEAAQVDLSTSSEKGFGKDRVIDRTFKLLESAPAAKR
ncbi:MAG TPA: hypothetical protein VGJ84_23205 [Polyangiaceae bacterium]